MSWGDWGKNLAFSFSSEALNTLPFGHPKEGLLRGLKEPKATFRQRHLYCLFDLAMLTDATLSELERRAILHGDYILAGHLLKEATVIWE